MSTRGSSKTILLLTAGLLVLASVVGAVGVRYTSQTSFCASCHEMTALHASWASGSHADVHCYECHVDKGVIGHSIAKVNGLRQLILHFTSDVDMADVHATVPRHRCAACHNMADIQKLGDRTVVAHRKHSEAKLECTSCHLTSGHSRERFVGFGNESCVECHSRKPQTVDNPYLKRPRCSRPLELTIPSSQPMSDAPERPGQGMPKSG